MHIGRSRVRLFPETGTAFALQMAPPWRDGGWQQSRLLVGDFKRLSLIIRCAINRLTLVLHRTSMTCTKQIFSNRRDIKVTRPSFWGGFTPIAKNFMLYCRLIYMVPPPPQKKKKQKLGRVTLTTGS